MEAETRCNMGRWWGCSSRGEGWEGCRFDFFSGVSNKEDVYWILGHEKVEFPVVVFCLWWEMNPVQVGMEWVDLNRNGVFSVGYLIPASLYLTVTAFTCIKYSWFCPYSERDNTSTKPFTCPMKMNIPLVFSFFFLHNLFIEIFQIEQIENTSPF